MRHREVMARFEPAGNLDAVIAARIAAPAVRKAADDIKDRAQRNAPPVHTWITAHDEAVRPTHREADGQSVPGNLRFAVLRPQAGDDANDVRAGRELGRAPRDPALSVGNRIHCRCQSVTVDGVIARLIYASYPVVTGTQVTAEVSVTFNRVGESEKPSTPDSGGGWMLTALMATAATLR